MWHGSVLIIMLPSHNIWFYIFNEFVLKNVSWDYCFIELYKKFFIALYKGI